MDTLDEIITTAFRTEYAFGVEIAQSDDERANALETAREYAAAQIPDGREGIFDDSTLSFRECYHA
jgi:hypothetical protein